jgi:branched-chain amino acid transport system substrate-binding protein
VVSEREQFSDTREDDLMWCSLIAAGVIALIPANAAAQETVKVALILPMTGPFTTTGKQVEAGARFYMQENGATAAGRKIELVLRDDGGVPDNSKRIAQELLARDKVDILAGFGLTPIALAVAPLATETRTPMIVMAAATAIVTLALHRTHQLCPGAARRGHCGLAVQTRA